MNLALLSLLSPAQLAEERDFVDAQTDRVRRFRQSSASPIERHRVVARFSREERQFEARRSAVLAEHMGVFKLGLRLGGLSRSGQGETEIVMDVRIVAAAALRETKMLYGLLIAEHSERHAPWRLVQREAVSKPEQTFTIGLPSVQISSVEFVIDADFEEVACATLIRRGN